MKAHLQLEPLQLGDLTAWISQLGDLTAWGFHTLDRTPFGSLSLGISQLGSGGIRVSDLPLQDLAGRTARQLGLREEDPARIQRRDLESSEPALHAGV